MQDPELVHYLPILTTLFSAAFVAALVRRAIPRHWPPHLLWWGIGVSAYGLGTLLESSITLFGNSPALNRWWYWAGAILGGYPLATGTVYLLLRRKTAHVLTAISLTLVLVATVAVFISPLNLDALLPYKPEGAVIGWMWVRLTTPFINGYAALFLIGGAFYSSFHFVRSGGQRNRAIGTALIAVGGILPGVGGSMAKAGIVEALYVGEFLGIILIWIGYEFCIRRTNPVAAYLAEETPAAQPRVEA
ncbi:MAG: hypothetical protein H6810_12880 [Phycisphaeraceae bacterium]|nr:MAG: hypothetical protein H6810_12880 [Phycisphaeraceae bacterium]